MPAPSIEYGQLSPMLIVFGVVVAGVLVEAFLPPRSRYQAQLALSLGGLIGAFAAVIVLARGVHAAGRDVAMGALAIDGPTLFLQGTLVLVTILAVLLIAERGATVGALTSAATGASGRGLVAVRSRGFDAFTAQASAIPGSLVEREASSRGLAQTEVFPLTMLALGGMLVLPAANDLLTVFVALEVVSLPLYLLCGLARHRRLMSQEAALKYFLLGAFSSAFFLYGVSLLYGYAGTLRLAGIGDAIATRGNDSMALVGVGLLMVGLLFKVGAVPFQSWIPDVYQGAPTPITAFMAAATKIAAFGAMLRIFCVALPGFIIDWRPVVWAVAILTMVIGALMTIRQTNMKRLVGYSSIANAGFILTGVIAANHAGLSSTMFYLFAYGFSTLSAFAVVGLVRNPQGEEDTALARWAGLGRRYPVVGIVFSLFLLAFAGIPLTSGFVSKFAVFKAAGEGGAIPLVVIGVIASAIAAYFYVRVIVLMFFTEPPDDAPAVVVPSVLTTAVVTITAAVTFALGALPQPLLDLANSANQFPR